eukprot:TRINITY_DN37152_c0_g2_i1.p1 TRINITY_DN37152_c0_g2~~TRINITY_DN37152_c0_g2_i1.p1  ORF type:complete len:682 (+),score=157.85 TRINITY_DN37152_c0_g2_i1:204-2249(+)
MTIVESRKPRFLEAEVVGSEASSSEGSEADPKPKTCDGHEEASTNRKCRFSADDDPPERDEARFARTSLRSVATVATSYSTYSRASRASRASRFHRGAHQEVKPEKKRTIYADVQEIKESMVEAVLEEEIDFRSLYKNRGIWQGLARNQTFESVSLAIIALNAVWIAVDTDHNKAELLLEAHWVFQLAENFFCFFFSFEYFVRAMAFRRICFGIYDNWFVFDGIMCGLMIAETWVFTSILLVMGEDAGVGTNTSGGSNLLKSARLLRLSRMMRMVRLMKAVPELLIMFKGLAAAFRPVFFTLVLLGSIVIVFAIAFTQLTHGYQLHDRYFSSILDSSYFLFVHGALLLSTDLKAPEIYAEGGLLLNLVFFTFVLLTSVLLMNMLIGVLCEVVIVVGATEKERFLVMFVKDRLQEVVALIDEDGGGSISRDEFMLIMGNSSAVEAMDAVGVDVIGLLDLADVIFGQEGEESSEDGSQRSGGVELTLKDFLELILQLRGSNQSTVKDFVDVRRTVTTIFEGQFKQLDSMFEKVHDLSIQLDFTTAAMLENQEILLPGECLMSTRSGEVGEAFFFPEDELLPEDVNHCTQDAEDEAEAQSEMVWQSSSSLALTVYEKGSEQEEPEDEPLPMFSHNASMVSLRPEFANNRFVRVANNGVMQVGQKMMRKVSAVIQKVKSKRASHH